MPRSRQPVSLSCRRDQARSQRRIAKPAESAASTTPIATRYGAASVASRGADAIERYVAIAPHGIDVAGLVAWARAMTGDPSAEVPVPSLRS